ncbi:hypothetical protein HOV42_gp56 [Gordonia phage Fairfaxidum]|uniref:Uncharacterized protein n=1 Tax=Gordonia phage Fairfaxidum TaxID=2572526 RepID=A0A4D6T6H0_9CAUD|nr:hypothetical protein HOV42_gp56 [Gordonia phage Fairfaxidum]QCG77639.1 hypothetical protein SEA_FAIRFAXIDUM_56 [Gordonia phage Fairfaxidum]
MTIRHDITGSVDLLTTADRFVSIADDRQTSLAEVPAGVYSGIDGRATHLTIDVTLGTLADAVLVTLPFDALAEFVDQVRETAQHGADLDGFNDALDHLPPRGKSRKYIDAYTLGQVEARERAL